MTGFSKITKLLQIIYYKIILLLMFSCKVLEKLFSRIPWTVIPVNIVSIIKENDSRYYFASLAEIFMNDSQRGKTRCYR